MGREGIGMTERKHNWLLLYCGVCGEEFWHNPYQSEIICVYCEEWAEWFALVQKYEAHQTT
jgi:uncharacterized CHY-type Zn-finger protein